MIGFVNENLGSIVPGPNELVGGEIIYDISQIGGRLDRELINDINTLLIQYRSYIDETKLRDGLATAVSISTRGNQYLQDSDISQLLSGDRERCAEVILNAVNLIYLLSVMIHPFMPAISSDILRQLNAPARNLPNIFSIDILPGHKLGKAEIMFEKIDNTDGKQEKAWQQCAYPYCHKGMMKADYLSGQALIDSDTRGRESECCYDNKVFGYLDTIVI